jgi:hypothetical protein
MLIAAQARNWGSIIFLAVIFLLLAGLAVRFGIRNRRMRTRTKSENPPEDL